MALLRQTWTLTLKNWLIVLGRHGFATVFRAFVLPIIIISFLSFSRNLFVPGANFGISSPHPIRSLSDGLQIAARSGRENVVFVHSGFTGGEIERVIDELATTVRAAGSNATVLASEADLPYVCRASLRGVTSCYGAVIFRASPSEGNGGLWNYTLRADGALGGGRIDVDIDTNDAQVYILPLQHAVNVAISRNNDNDSGNDGAVALPDAIDQYPFTPETPEERADRIRVMFQDTLANALGVTFLLGLIGTVYHMTGFIATERETGMSTLIEAMMTTRSRWQPQAARLVSYHFSFSILYLPGWVVCALILWSGVWAKTSALVVLLYFILAGLALSSMSILGAAFFKKSQLSGVTVTILYILLAVIAQVVTAPTTGTVMALSLLFAPCNFTYFVTLLSRWEKEQWPTDLLAEPPNSPWNIPGVVFFVFLAGQTIIYPILGALVERWLHGTTSSGRNIVMGENRGDLGPDCAVQLDDFTKIYKPGIVRRMFSFFSKPKDPVVAVNKLTLAASRGQILALLGANGSGKSTTLDTIAGINKATSGRITIDGTGGLGIAPQKNVLWDELTVEEHIRIFNKLKSPGNHATKDEIRQLVVSVDLEKKIKAKSGTLSGGQKRKLQLGMMLTGGSAVCCVDEVSSGLDPLSRRKIWDILLAERGRRTIILTTHFLDEADLLADYIAVMSKGNLRAKGTSVELKDRLGGGYRIHVNSVKLIPSLPDIAGVTKKATHEEAAYIASTSSLAAMVIKELEAAGITDYRFSGPTIEDVFLQLADEVKGDGGAEIDQRGVLSSADEEKSAINAAGSKEKGGLELLSGRRVGFLRQTWVLFLKRCVIFKGNWFPSLAAFAIPVAAAGLVMLFVRDQDAAGCSPADQSSRREAVNLFDGDFDLFMVGGPAERFSQETLMRLFTPIFLGSQGGSSLAARAISSPADFFRNLTIVDSFDDFTDAIVQYRKNVTPAGIWLGDDSSRPTLVYKGDRPEMINAWFGQWVMDMLLTNMTIASTYIFFDTPFNPDMGDSLQVLVYIGLALCAYPAFFSLYPNLERRRNVRGLQYSNGVRPLPLWLAYTSFDFVVVLAGAVISIALFAGLAPNVWYHVGYVFVVFMLHGLASIILAYNISLFSANQLSAYAFTAAGQVILLLIYLIAYICVMVYAPVHRIDSLLLVVHFVISALAPIVSVCRALFVALNLFATSCDGDQLATTPADMVRYGGPIVYLIAQIIVLFVILVWADGGSAGFSLRRMFFRSSPSAPSTADDERAAISDEEVANELVRVKTSASAPGNPTTDGLRVINLTKSFGSNTAVDNVTFGIPHGEVFALLGPNGAGKSTTISVIRGDIKPSGGARGGDVFVEDASVTRNLAAARSHLGVCPQFDAVDQMTVEEHLRFYARVRGIPDVGYNVDAVIRAVGLQAFSTRQAHALSGGNKRKLSLGIALMGNPSVVLLDEPSSGLDAAAKRIMWRTLAATVPGRSILLTTHSMEEADALAGRAGILAKRMLAMGGVDQLRKRFGDRLYVHLVCKGAPRTSEEHVRRIKGWIAQAFGGRAEVEEKTYHGQMRFSIPAEMMAAPAPTENSGTDEITSEAGTSSSSSSAIGKLVVLLEENREFLGVEHFSVSPTTLDQVFLTVVGQHNVKEEGYETREGKKKRWWRMGKCIFFFLIFSSF
ncbi:ATP-binding cassette sub-family A member 5 [Madurella mycetomatis]|uniref:ATP-binding cassette sub-family A member 5 n=1 Tax=Madurella mycetomatis TaxID=100816 RepID=A0A150ASL4_9PEZI|nr:ATP-binding cassette sub-family A member 5 [Madurella mycetomatis]